MECLFSATTEMPKHTTLACNRLQRIGIKSPAFVSAPFFPELCCGNFLKAQAVHKKDAHRKMPIFLNPRKSDAQPRLENCAVENSGMK
jgi:hypothetical protein